MLYGHSQDASFERAIPIIQDTLPEYWKVIDPSAELAKVVAEQLGVKLVVRHHLAVDWAMVAYDNPKGAADNWWTACRNQPWYPYSWAVETPNEPLGETDYRIPAYTQFEEECVRLFRADGKECVVNNLGTGNKGHLVRGATYYGAHVYGWPSPYQQDYVLVQEWFSEVRRRQPEAKLFVTELGITRLKVGGEDRGWLDDGPSAEYYWRGLVDVDAGYSWVFDGPYLGSFIYQVGANPDWSTFEVLGTDLEAYLRQYLQQNDTPGGSTVATIQVGKGVYEDVRALYPDRVGYGTRDIGSIDAFVVHHSVTPGREQSTEDEHRTLQLIYKYHQDTNSWPGIGYHAVVFPSGRVYITGGAESVRYHVGSANATTYGVCLVGTFMTSVPTQEQLAATRKLMGDLAYGLGGFRPVRGHKYYGGTACPGDTWDSWSVKVDPQIPELPTPTDWQMALDEALVALANAKAAVERAKSLEP